MFIVFEGPDGCGKTTLARAFAGAKGFHYTREPTFSSEEADRLNLKQMNPADREVEFLIDRILHQSEIKNQIRKQNSVACDRYIWSALAYARVFSSSTYSFLKTVYTHRYFKKPDCYIMVKTDLKVCRSRCRKVQSDEQLKTLRDAYDMTHTCVRDSKIIEVDNSGLLEDTLKDLLRKLGRLWPDLGPTVTQTGLFYGASDVTDRLFQKLDEL